MIKIPLNQEMLTERLIDIEKSIDELERMGTLTKTEFLSWTRIAKLHCERLPLLI